MAQTSDAKVSGTVSDPQGAQVVGATVVATNVDTGVSVTTSTNEAGVYVFPALPVGKYRISAEHAGFRKATISDIVLNVGAQLTVNLPLELGQTTETVEVSATAATVNASNATVGNVVEDRKILDLPLVGRSAYDLVNTQPGVIINGANGVNINGSQTGAVNYTTDGINTQDNLLNGAFNANVANTVSIDRVEEFRIVTSPADAEYGRGSGQIQLVTRGGTNRFAGSAWEEIRNTDLNANDWFNNFSGQPRNVLIRNQFGLRLGGPVKKGKTFFNGIWEEDHQNQKVTVNSTVFTPSALAGNFRFFPGVLNGNAASVNPTVNTSGQPVQPANATGGLQTVSVFGKDPLRPGPDPTGTITKYLGIMPAPNNYLVGDGLNTAGFLWARPVIDDFQLYEGRIDHNFNDKHRLTLTLNHQAYTSTNVANPQPYPLTPVGLAPTETTQYSAHFTSTLRPNLLNELTFGAFRPRTIIWEDLDPNAGPPGVAGQKLLPTANGIPYYPGFASAITNPLVSPGGPTGTGSSNRMTQNWQYGEAITWIRGRHQFKGGIETRRIGNEGYDTGGVTPVSVGGAGTAFPITGINTISGIGSNATAATNLLADLSGTISSISQALNSTGGTNPVFLPGMSRYSDLHTPEYSVYFKDDWKVTPSLTLNLGVRYEWYGVPADLDGRGVGVIGGTAGLFGISGTNDTALFNPGASGGSLTNFQPVGPKTANSGAQLYQNDNTNWAPFVGFAWALPGEGSMKWLTGGKDRMVIRAGYGIAYQRDPFYLTHQAVSFEPNAVTTTPTFQATSAPLNVGNVTLPIASTIQPFATTALNGLRNTAAYGFNNSLRNPRIQNFNFSIERYVGDTGITVQYVGSSTSRVVRLYDLNEVNILNNGFLQAFQTVQQGGTSALMDSLLSAVKLNSTTVRSFPALQTFFENNNPAGLAAALNSSAFNGVGGSLVAAAGLPANFFVVNPQFADAFYIDSNGHASFHSLQAQVNRRLKHGFTLQGSFVWSKALGDDSAGDNAIFLADYRTLRNFNLDKQLLAFNHAAVWKINGIYELPFGPGKPILGNTNAVLGKIIGGWQLGGIFLYETGAPISVTAANNGLNTSLAAATANQIGAVPTGVTRLGSGVTFFPGVTQGPDPSIANITTLGNLQALSPMKAILVNGSPVLTNPLPGQLGNLAIDSFTGPRVFRIDANLQKAITFRERYSIQFRMTAENLTNTETFAAPATTNIDSASFGRITSTATGFTPRIFAGQIRLYF